LVSIEIVLHAKFHLQILVSVIQLQVALSVSLVEDNCQLIIAVELPLKVSLLFGIVPLSKSGTLKYSLDTHQSILRLFHISS